MTLYLPDCLSFVETILLEFYFHFFLVFPIPEQQSASSKCQSGNVRTIATVQSFCQKSPGPGPNMSQNFLLTLSFQELLFLLFLS